VQARDQPKAQGADLTGIRQRGAWFQVRIFGGMDPATGRQLILTGSAATEAEALALRDGFRKQVADHTAVRTNVTLRVLLAEWLAGHQVEPSTRAGYALLIDNFIVPALGEQTLPALAKLGPRPYERLFADLGACRRRCAGKPFIEHRTPRQHECDDRCATHSCRPLAASTIRQCHAVLSSAYGAREQGCLAGQSLLGQGHGWGPAFELGGGGAQAAKGSLWVTGSFPPGGEHECRAEADVRLGRDRFHVGDAAEPLIDPDQVVTVDKDAGHREVGGHHLGGVFQAGC